MSARMTDTEVELFKAQEHISELEAENKLLWKTIDVCETAIDEASSFVDGYYLETGECLLPAVKEAYDAIDVAREGD